jgi:hypothetical protein
MQQSHKGYILVATEALITDLESSSPSVIATYHIQTPSDHVCNTGRLLGPWSALNRLTTKHVQPYSPLGILKLLAEVIFAAKKQYHLLSGRLSNKC